MYNLNIKQKVLKFRDQYEVTDDFDNPIYFVNQTMSFLGFKVVVDKTDGSSSFVIEKERFTWLPKYHVTFDNKNAIEIHQKFSFFKKEIEVYSEDYSLVLEGDIWGLDFTVYDENAKVGFIEKEFFSFADKYVIRVIDSKYEEELLALLIVLDNIKDMENRSSSGSN